MGIVRINLYNMILIPSYTDMKSEKSVVNTFIY